MLYGQWRTSFYFVYGGTFSAFIYCVGQQFLVGNINVLFCPFFSFFVLFCPFFFGQASTNKKGQKRTPCRKIKCESTTTENTRSHKAKKLGAIRGHVGAILHLVDAPWQLLGPIWGSVGTKSQYSDVMGTENKKKNGCLFLLGTLRSGCLCLSTLH